MPLFFLVILPILEIYAFVRVGDHFGYVNAIFALLISMVVGVGVAKSQGRFIYRHLQQSVAQRKVPESRVVHSLLIFIGGVLMVVPGFLTTLAGIVFVLPGTRHLLAFWLKTQLMSQIGLGRFGVFAANGLGGFRFGSGGFGGGFRGAGFGAAGAPHSAHATAEAEARERDVTPRIIDVTPLSSAPRPKAGSKTNSDFDPAE